MTQILLPIETILDSREGCRGDEIGRSREDRPIAAHRLGSGEIRISLIGGCHADEPVGPGMLAHLAAFLSTLGGRHELLTRFSWTIAPHVNPDGAERNRSWSRQVAPTFDHQGRPDSAYDLLTYARSVVRERPGDDIEFGFPRSPEDLEARPENRAVADLMRTHGPFHLHGSFHGMAFAPGPWFLLDRTWIDRTTEVRDRLRRVVADMGYGLLDWDRQGDKGFRRIDEGFSTRPDSQAMRQHFLDRGDADTAELFRPSSMEMARSLGGDPLTFVSEMPLFLHDDPTVLSSRREEFRSWLSRLVTSADDTGRAEIETAGIRSMPIRDQMRLQLHLLQEALGAVDLVTGTGPQS